MVKIIFHKYGNFFWAVAINRLSLPCFWDASKCVGVLDKKLMVGYGYLRGAIEAHILKSYD